jgi:hypothetical protein
VLAQVQPHPAAIDTGWVAPPAVPAVRNARNPLRLAIAMAARRCDAVSQADSRVGSAWGTPQHLPWHP